ncbi:transporter suffix domain-containing protein [Robiginitalea aurantiaca]|uniref:Transporter suffix domain-containing protein n=1 Tax=Robiginitalea aurantiaca TaxID=3056915 RepID=A0ABT7WII3_9FLAO|nr:transporter suffix domain-containing protein [Robiginitalea aurantiaca]MDM9632720.1 transporter suffix domain-containing protein [Robiginitalea aurantiaca]
MAEKTVRSPRITFGIFIMVIGFLSPLLIPLVLGSSWSAATKTTLSGLLAFGVPEVLMMLAVAIMGKQGYELIKRKARQYFKRIAPPDTVSRTRYHFGLFLFCMPLLIGLLQPYIEYFIPSFGQFPLWVHIILDMTLIIGIFVLGGDFWDKFSGLFKYGVNVESKENEH